MPLRDAFADVERLRILCFSVALGYDEGTVVIKIGREEPVASMDSGGKVIWARQNEIQTVNVRSLSEGEAEVSPATAVPMAGGAPQLHATPCDASSSMNGSIGLRWQGCSRVESSECCFRASSGGGTLGSDDNTTALKLRAVDLCFSMSISHCTWLCVSPLRLLKARLS